MATDNENGKPGTTNDAVVDEANAVCRFSQDGWQEVGPDGWLFWYNYKSCRCIYGIFSCYSLVASFSFFSLVALMSFFSITSTLSMLSINCSFCILSIVSYLNFFHCKTQKHNNWNVFIIHAAWFLYQSKIKRLKVAAIEIKCNEKTRGRWLGSLFSHVLFSDVH